jgi:RNA 3'-terminal phosphate cyclase (ATP)
VFQAILPYMLFDGGRHITPASKNIKIRILGGTNVSKSPSIEYVQHVLLPTLATIGLPSISVALEKRGWSTGRTEMGSVMVTVEPLSAGSTFDAFSLMDRGEIRRIEVYALMPAACKKDVEAEVTAKAHTTFGQEVELHIHFEDSRHPKRMCLLMVAISANGHRLGRDWLFDHKIKDATSAVRALVKRVVMELEEEISHGGCVDEYMRDQLVVFQALAAGCSQIDPGIASNGQAVQASLHALTAYWVANQVVGVEFDREGICTGCAILAKGTVNESEIPKVTEGIKELGV